MAEQQGADGGIHGAGSPMRRGRRGLVAGAAALAAALIAKQAAQPVLAASLTLSNNDTVTNVGTAATVIAAATALNGTTLFRADATTATSPTSGIVGIEGRGAGESAGVVGVGGEIGVEFGRGGLPVGGGDGGFGFCEVGIDAWSCFRRRCGSGNRFLRLLCVRGERGCQAGKNTEDGEKAHRYLNRSLSAEN